MSALRSGWRARGHPGWWAFLVHRLSGIALTLFLPLHFWALSQSLAGEQALDAFLRFTDAPLFKFAEWGLVLLLSAHLGGGLRLLAIEFGPWRGLRKSWIGLAAAASMLAGIAFAVALVIPA
ncbi:MAG TPA: succinate dehydrogenase, cytochrome b556 subunit [Burkholderiaceae bacterium]